ncbi:hypothetical protein KRP22_004668 [Phytophthora ramorum]|nr:hypothetical protein KRP22_10299 [Phytophthora ramorum]
MDVGDRNCKAFDWLRSLKSAMLGLSGTHRDAFTLALAARMTPKISLALGFQGHHEKQIHKNPSILAGDEDHFDDEEWEEHVKPRRRSSSVEALSSCLTTLSSSLNDARAALTTHTKKLYPRGSTRRDNQLRNSMVEVSSSQAQHSLARANSMPATHWSSESDLDLFAGVEDDELDDEDAAKARLSKIDAPPRGSTSCRSMLSKLLPTRSWTQGSKK